MPIPMVCLHCELSAELNDQFAGVSVKCPKCGQPMTARTLVHQSPPISAREQPAAPRTAVLRAPAAASGPAARDPAASGAPAKTASPAPSASRHFFESDNLGTRQDQVSKADAYWNARQMKEHKEPYLLYTSRGPD